MTETSWASVSSRGPTRFTTWPFRHRSPYKTGTIRKNSMGALPPRICQMNGIGNEIVVGRPARFDRGRHAGGSACGRRAPLACIRPAHGAARRRVLRAPRLSSASTTMTAPKPPPAATACAAWCGSCSRKPVRTGRHIRNQGRPIELLAGPGQRSLYRRHGPAENSAGRIFRWRKNFAIPDISNYRSGRSTRRCCIRRRWSAWAIRMRSSGSTTSMPTISSASARSWKNHPIFPERAISRSPHIVDRDHITIRNLGARRGTDKSLRFGGVCDRQSRRRG